MTDPNTWETLAAGWERGRSARTRRVQSCGSVLLWFRQGGRWLKLPGWCRSRACPRCGKRRAADDLIPLASSLADLPAVWIRTYPADEWSKKVRDAIRQARHRKGGASVIIHRDTCTLVLSTVELDGFDRLSRDDALALVTAALDGAERFHPSDTWKAQPGWRAGGAALALDQEDRR